jgi:hypothetical protein
MRGVKPAARRAGSFCRTSGATAAMRGFAKCVRAASAQPAVTSVSSFSSSTTSPVAAVMPALAATQKPFAFS